MIRRALALVPVLSFAVAAGGCGAEEAPGTADACKDSRDLVVAMSDYSSSGVAAVRLSDATNEARFGVDLGKDPWLAQSAGRLFLIARDLDLVFELDPACGAPKARFSVHDDGVGIVQNPQDLALDAAGRAWIPRFSDGTVLVVDGASRRTISLAAYDDDRKPDPTSVRIVSTAEGERAFVVLERLDPDLRSRRPSALLEIDTASASPVAAHPLKGRNPFGAMVEHEGAFLLAEPGDFDAASEGDAGIERFDPRTRTSELLVREADLGGSITELSVTGRCAAAIVADPVVHVNATSLVAIDLSARKVVQAAAVSPLRTPGYELQGLALHEGGVLVGDRRQRQDGTYAIHRFSFGADCTLSAAASALSVPQKPVSLRRAPSAVTSPSLRESSGALALGARALSPVAAPPSSVPAARLAAAPRR